jgi:hypothetical protein
MVVVKRTKTWTDPDSVVTEDQSNELAKELHHAKEEFEGELKNLKVKSQKVGLIC